MGETLPNLMHPVAAEPARPTTPAVARPEQLALAAFVAPPTMTLEFADGQRFSLAIESLGMPMDGFEWSTLKVSPGGEEIVVQDVKGESIPIDSASLRYLVDPRYAAKVDESIRTLHLSAAEFDEAARLLHNPAWDDIGNEDDL